MSLSHSAQIFCPGGRVACGEAGGGSFVSGADTDLKPAIGVTDGVTIPL